MAPIVQQQRGKTPWELLQEQQPAVPVGMLPSRQCSQRSQSSPAGNRAKSWAASHPRMVQTPWLGGGAPHLAATIQLVPHRTRAQGAQHGQNQKVYLHFSLIFFSRLLTYHHSFLSCLCSLKHNRPLTSAVPHNVTIMNK